MIPLGILLSLMGAYGAGMATCHGDLGIAAVSLVAAALGIALMVREVARGKR